MTTLSIPTKIERIELKGFRRLSLDLVALLIVEQASHTVLTYAGRGRAQATLTELQACIKASTVALAGRLTLTQIQELKDGATHTQRATTFRDGDTPARFRANIIGMLDGLANNIMAELMAEYECNPDTTMGSTLSAVRILSQQSARRANGYRTGLGI